MRVAIIGAGPAGLASARHVTSRGFICQVFEMAPEVGGTWVYTDAVGKDKYGYPVHTAMYQNLRTNLPKAVMGFPDFPIPKQTDSYLSQEDILEFLNVYTDHFNLKSVIKFNEIVIDVRPVDNKWQVTSIHKPSKQITTNIHDVVMICNGHYNMPSIPSIPGQEKFKGQVIHSHHYRSVNSYKGRRVLIVGAGFSGLDIAVQIASVAKEVTISHRAIKKDMLDSMSNVIHKPEILRFNNSQEVEFVDGTISNCEDIVYCTGYKYNFPFLHKSCGVVVEDNRVQPLYKQVIHIERPTMCFIGIPFFVCAFQLVDIQARFYCQYLNGFMSLPSNEMMYKDTEDDIKKRRENGFTQKQTHMLGFHQQEYYDDLAFVANLPPLPPVIYKIFAEGYNRYVNNLLEFRNDNYRIINNESFIRMK